MHCPRAQRKSLDAPFDAAVAAVAADDRVHGVIAETGFAAALRPRLAARRGAIVPLFVGDMSATLWRLAAEQTLTVNTAAAGGNAALLAGHQSSLTPSLSITGPQRFTSASMHALEVGRAAADGGQALGVERGS